MPYNRLEPYNDLPNLPPIFDLYQPAIMRALATAARYLGELNGLCATLPEPLLLLNTLVLQESRDSSAIENIVTTQDELYRASLEETPENSSAKEVLSYREATYRGLERMKNQHNLITTNTLIEVAQTIGQNRASIRQTPGTNLRNATTGEVTYTPPCCEAVIQQKLADLEQFINEADPDGPDPLVKLALIHYQFEAIHPFLDGNGRAGRILIALYLVQQNLLPQPVLYLSRYINRNRNDYYRLLRQVTEQQTWAEWVVYILTGIAQTAQLTTAKIRRILALMKELEGTMRQTLKASYDAKLLQLMFAQPYLKTDFLVQNKLAHRQTASVYLKRLAEANILIARPRGRTVYYVNQRLIDVLTD